MARDETAETRAPEKARVSRFRVKPHSHGLELADGTVVPLIVGALHYWRHHPSEWAPALDAMKAMGFNMVDTYVPWGAHEISEGAFDFGERNARLDVARFLRLAHERGFYVVIRPGPHINAELTWFGLPERVVWNRACQARSPRDNPVMLPMVPVAFPVPSYASESFHEEVERWFEAVGAVLSPFRYPEGPIVLLQVDNEGAFYFRDGPYDQDYHPDSLELFRSFLRAKYKRPSALRRAWGDRDKVGEELGFGTAAPPVRFDAESADDLPRQIDWIEYQEHLLATSINRMAKRLAESGMDGIPTMHNFPLGEAATPLNAARFEGALDFVGLDYYHRAAHQDHMIIMRRTTELAVRSEGTSTPAYGAEVGAGAPPFFGPHEEEDSIYTLVTALAYGLRGFNLYMAVDRDRWVGAPIDSHGMPRPFADTYKHLFAALTANDFHTLKRHAPVRLVIPRALRRLARASHAFGNLTPALFAVLGAGYGDSCFEEPFDGTEGTGRSPTLAAETFIRTFERALLSRGVPFAYAGGETLEPSTKDAQWVICAAAGGLKPELLDQLRALRERGVRVTLGPREIVRDGSWRKLTKVPDTSGLDIEPEGDIARADLLVSRAIDDGGVSTHPVHPSSVFCTVHEDETGPRLVFVMNPTAEPVPARISVAGVASLEEIFPGSDPAPIPRREGACEVRMAPKSVRIFRARRG